MSYMQFFLQIIRFAAIQAVNFFSRMQGLVGRSWTNCNRGANWLKNLSTNFCHKRPRQKETILQQ